MHAKFQSLPTRSDSLYYAYVIMSLCVCARCVCTQVRGILEVQLVDRPRRWLRKVSMVARFDHLDSRVTCNPIEIQKKRLTILGCPKSCISTRVCL